MAPVTAFTERSAGRAAIGPKFDKFGGKKVNGIDSNRPHRQNSHAIKNPQSSHSFCSISKITCYTNKYLSSQSVQGGKNTHSDRRYTFRGFKKKNKHLQDRTLANKCIYINYPCRAAPYKGNRIRHSKFCTLPQSVKMTYFHRFGNYCKIDLL